MDVLFTSRKRVREEDECTVGTKRMRNGFEEEFPSYDAEHNLSILPPLPPFNASLFGPSLECPRWMNSSDSDIPPALEPPSVGSPASTISLPTPVEANDGAMMIDYVSIVDSPNLSTPQQDVFIKAPKPPKLFALPAPDQHLAGGRVPTPIFPSFPAEAQQQHPMRPPPIPIRLPSIFVSSSSRLDPAIPSPICEGDMDAEMDAEYVYAGSRLSQLSFREDSMDVDEGVESISPLSSPRTTTGPKSPSPLPSPTTHRIGRARSGAIIERRRFFMGYRDDCDKCRLKVPNHFAHFVPAS